MKRFLVYSAAVPSEPLLPLGDMQAGLIRFSFCRLKSKDILIILVKGHIKRHTGQKTQNMSDFGNKNLHFLTTVQ